MKLIKKWWPVIVLSIITFTIGFWIIGPKVWAEDEREYSCDERWAAYYAIPDKNKGFIVKPDCPKPSLYSGWITEPEEPLGLSEPPITQDKYAECSKLKTWELRWYCMNEILKGKIDTSEKALRVLKNEIQKGIARTKNIKPCPWSHMSVSLFAYQGYESPDKYNPRHKYEGQAVEEALNKYPDWTFVHLQWEGEPIDPYFQMTRRGYIIVKKRICQD